MSSKMTFETKHDGLFKIGKSTNYLQLNEKEELRLNKEIKQLDRDEAEAVFRIEPTAMRKGRLEGRKEGRKEGELRKEKELIRGMLAEGIDVEMISRISKLSVEEIEQIRKMNQNNG